MERLHNAGILSSQEYEWAKDRLGQEIAVNLHAQSSELSPWQGIHESGAELLTGQDNLYVLNMPLNEPRSASERTNVDAAVAFAVKAAYRMKNRGLSRKDAEDLAAFDVLRSAKRFGDGKGLDGDSIRSILLLYARTSERQTEIEAGKGPLWRAAQQGGLNMRYERVDTDGYTGGAITFETLDGRDGAQWPPASE